MNYAKIAKDAGELAFEHDLGESPERCWRVCAMRDWNGRSVRHVNWFATREAAHKYAAWLADSGDAILEDISEYTRAPLDITGADL